MEKKRCFNYVSQHKSTILKHKLNNYFLEECKRSYTMIPAGLSKPSLQFRIKASQEGLAHTSRKSLSAQRAQNAAAVFSCAVQWHSTRSD